MSPGEPTRRLNVAEVEEPPVPPTLWQRWGQLPTPVQAATIVGALCGVMVVLTPVAALVFHERTLGNNMRDALGLTVALLIVWLAAVFFVAVLKGELD